MNKEVNVGTCEILILLKLILTFGFEILHIYMVLLSNKCTV